MRKIEKEIIELKELTDFCRSCANVYIYGAGIYANGCRRYLDLYGIVPKGFIISKSVKKDASIYEMPIYNKSILKNLKEDDGVILAVAEQYREPIVEMLDKEYPDLKVIKFDDFYYRAMVDTLPDNYHFLELLDMYGEISEEDIPSYQKKAKKLLDRYDEIEVRYLPIHLIALAGNWIYALERRRYDKNLVYHLYVPVVFDMDTPYLKWYGVNKYLADKMEAEGVALISEKNIAFWNYMYSEHGDRFWEYFEEADCTYVDFSLKYNRFLDRIIESGKYVQDGKPYFKLEKDEIESFEKERSDMGIGDHFVCVYTRDAGYQETVKMRSKKDLKILKYRNADIRTYKLATQYLYAHGYQSVRMGQFPNSVLEAPGVVDYGSKYRSEHMDYYLMSKCKFFILQQSGISAIANLCRKPLLLINGVDICIWGDYNIFFCPSTDLAIMKKLWNPKEERYLTLRDMLDYNTVMFYERKRIEGQNQSNAHQLYAKDGIVPVDNTPEEIRDITEEMMLRLDGKWVPEPEDEALQKKYLDIIQEYRKRYPEFSYCKFRMGAKFLRENPWFLE